MLHDTSKENNVLSCKNCQGHLVEEKILPCGKTVCSLCASKIKVNGNEFDCLVCKNKHEWPKNGFISNDILLEILSAKPTSISAYDLLNKSLDNIQQKQNQFKVGI